jgi:glycosyltransferase involved in cell wall biosynthesis
MKIGIVVDNDLNNDNRVIREITILKEQKHELFILCLDFGRYYSDPVSGIVVKRITLNRKIKDLLFFFQNLIPVYEWFWALNISRFISIYNIEALHVHDLYMSEPSHRGIVRSGRKIPLILDLHENYSYAVTTYNWTKGFLRSLVSRPHLWKEKEEKLLRYARKIIVLSREFRDELLKSYASLLPDNFCVFPNVPDLEQIIATKEKTKLAFPFSEKAPLLFYFGTVAERRGIFDALEVFRKLQGKAINVRLMIAGPVDKKDRKRFFRVTGSNDIKSKVSYIPWINYRELPDYLEISDICLAPFLKNPQHDSGVANKIYDYMFGSRPVVASDCRPQKNLIEKYKCGLIFSDLEEFEEAIITLLMDDNLRREMGRNGYNAVVNELNTGNFKENLIKTFEDLKS